MAALVLVLAVGGGPRRAFPGEGFGQRVLVVYNRTERESKRVAEHYAAKREIPETNLCAIRPLTLDDNGTRIVRWDDYEKAIEGPIRKCLEKAGRDGILYIVFSYLTPYRLVGLPGRHKEAALDSYVSDVWDDSRRPGPEGNPYFAEMTNRTEYYPPFMPLERFRALGVSRPIYAVWRLDAPTAALARGLVDKAMEAERAGIEGQACVDRRFGDVITTLDEKAYAGAEWSLYRAAQFAREAGLPVTEDGHGEEFGTAPAPLRCDNAILYAGWYSLNHYNDVFTWNVGAIGWHLDSASLADPRGGKNWSANAVRRGITVTSGAVVEPFIQAMPLAGGVVHNLFEGANVGDAFLRNTRWLKWAITNVGDPLYRPFPGGRPPFNGVPVRKPANDAATEK